MQRDYAVIPAGGGAVTSAAPAGKDHCHLSLLAQDPHRLFVWWNVPAPVLRFAAAGQPAREPLRLVLRVYEISPPATAQESYRPPATAPESYRLWLDIEVGPQNALYLHVPGNGRTYVAELGVYEDGAYRPLLRSLPHTTPWGEPAEAVDPAWPPLEMLYRTIRPLSFPSSPQGLYAP